MRFLFHVSALLLASSPVLALAEFSDFRALWVSRFEYNANNPASVQTIMNNAAAAGFTDILFQVRGKSDAYYDSQFEPRAEGLNSVVDPLETAVTSAHANGLKLHAWINTAPLWRDTAAPNDLSHTFYNTNPSFRRFDINGTPESPTSNNGEYASVNPVLPEVHTHLNNVVSDIATNYNVDGVHLDYIRWIGSQSFDNLLHDSVSYDLFDQATGLDGSNPANANAYRAYIKNRITDLVGSLKTTVDGVETSSGRDIDLSAAVWRDPDIAENERLQDYRTWLENDLLDIAMPMIYLSSSNNNLFTPNLTNTLNIPTNTRIAPGLGTYLHTASGGGVDLTLNQLATANNLGADGATFFSYNSFFNSSDPLSTARRTAVQDFYDNLEDPTTGGNLSPDANVFNDFDTDEGYFGNSPTLSGSNQGILSATADRTTSEFHLGTHSQEISVSGDSEGWFLRHLAGTGSAGSPGSNLALASTGSIGFWLKTDDAGLSVQLAIDDPGTADRGLVKSIISDGEWHLYEWDLEDDSQWEGWVTGDGLITGPTVTLDSIQFFGFGDATVYLDTIAHNPLGSLVVAGLAGDFNGDGTVDAADYTVWRESGGSEADYKLWRSNYGATTETATTEAVASVPEPAGALLLLLASCGFLASRRR